MNFATRLRVFRWSRDTSFGSHHRMSRHSASGEKEFWDESCTRGSCEVNCRSIIMLMRCSSWKKAHGFLRVQHLADPTARAAPASKMPSKCRTNCSRDEIFSRSRWTPPCEFFTKIVAVSLPHSILPSHRQGGGWMGRVLPISYRQAFWLLEPELSTRTFMG